MAENQDSDFSNSTDCVTVNDVVCTTLDALWKLERVRLSFRSEDLILVLTCNE